MTAFVTAPLTAIVLAGSRGPSDPVAAAAGVSHKALAPVAGVPMLARVLETLASVPRIGRVLVSIEDPGLLRDCGGITALPAAGTPSRSVLAVLDAVPDSLPCLVTTADHPLLTPAMVEHFWNHLPPGADVAAGLARAEIVRAAHPRTRRTWLRFRGDAFSGCNLFALRTPAARRVLDFWCRVEQDRKRPWRMIRTLGPGALLSYALGRLSLDAALAGLGRRTGAVAGVVEMPFAEAAIDVDRPEDRALVEAILVGRTAPHPTLPRWAGEGFSLPPPPPSGGGSGWG